MFLTSGRTAETASREASPKPEASDTGDDTEEEEAVFSPAPEDKEEQQVDEDDKPAETDQPKENHVDESLEHGEQIMHPLSPDYNPHVATPTPPPDHTPSTTPDDPRGFLDTDEASNILAGELPVGRKQGAGATGSTTVGIPFPRCVQDDGFTFAMHRRIVSVCRREFK